MARGYCPVGAEFEVGGSEDLAQRQALAGQIVVAQRASLVRIVKNQKPPASGWWRTSLGHEIQLCSNAPGRAKIVVHLLLKRVHDWLNIAIRQYRTGVYNRHVDQGHGNLPFLKIGISDFKFTSPRKLQAASYMRLRLASRWTTFYFR